MSASMRYQFVEAREQVGGTYGFLVRGDRESAVAEIHRLVKDWPGHIVELGGGRIPAWAIDPVSILIRHETEPRGTGPDSGRPRYAIDGTFIDGQEEA
jgi:hypothetical protein